MRVPEPLAAYVRDALAAGHGRAEITAALRTAGWSDREAEAALGAWVDASPLPPVPRPRETVSARDALRFAVLFFTLGLVATHLNQLVFALIDIWVPALSERPQPLRSGWIRWSVAVLVVAFPVWAWATLSLAGSAASDPGQARGPVARWFTAAALFLAITILLGDVMALLVGFLGGDLEVRFLLKALTVGTIAGVVLFYYGRGLGAPTSYPSGLRMVAGAGIATVAAITAGLWLVGSPEQERRNGRDAVRLSNLREASRALVCQARFGSETYRPVTLAQISPDCLSPARSEALVDPLTEEPYRIDQAGENLLRVCATFENLDERNQATFAGFPPFDPGTGCVTTRLEGA